MATLKGKRILIIEDEQAICRLCDRVLTEEGYEIEITNSGEKAQEKIVENQYDLLFTDIRLSNMSGIELYEWLQINYPETADRVAFTTRSVIGGKTNNFLSESGRPHLYKPFGPDELRAFIEKALRHGEKVTNQAKA